MDQNTVSLIGIIDILQHIVKKDGAAKKNKELRAACQRLESIREELLTESIRYSKLMGAARDSVFEASNQLQGHLTEARDMQWVVHGLQTVNVLDVQPPSLPPSSSTGPKAAIPAIIQVTRDSSPQPGPKNRLTRLASDRT